MIGQSYALISVKIFISKYFKYLILAVLIYAPIFSGLGDLPIRIWDESICAVNAYEMLRDGDYIVTHSNGRPEMWYLKPPLAIWAKVLFMKFLGPNEWAVRLPSAFAALFTCGLVLFFCLRYLHNFWIGFIAIGVLITSSGYVGLHGTRTGDPDALLALFTTLGGISYFLFTVSRRNRYLYLFFLGTAFAVLTKGVAALFFFPAYVIYSLWQGQFISLLRNKHFYFGLISFLVVILGYYLLREARTPGYIMTAIAYESARYLRVIEGHAGGLWYYYDLLTTQHFSAWCLYLPFGFLIGLFGKDKKIFKVSVFLSLSIFVFFLVISTAKSKVPWYDVSLYPYLALLVSIAIYSIYKLFNKLQKNIVPFVFLFLIFFAPYRQILAHLQDSWEGANFYAITNVLREALNGRQDVNGYYLLDDGCNLQHMFYVKVLQGSGVDISFRDWRVLHSSDYIIVREEEINKYIKPNYSFRIIEATNKVFKCKIHQRIKKDRLSFDTKSLESFFNY